MSQDLPITSYALLGLLTFGRESDGGLTGYELKQRADFTLRFYWVSPAMSQVYSELRRLTGAGLVAPHGEGRGTSYTVTAAGRRVLEDWMGGTPAGFPVFKHPVALRLMIGHLAEPGTLRRMLEEYAEQVADARADLADVRSSLVGSDAPGEPFHHPSLVADWGLAHFDSEAEITRTMLQRLADHPPDPEEET
jgi:DNA-binding PadR family transcriptional regulator